MTGPLPPGYFAGMKLVMRALAAAVMLALGVGIEPATAEAPPQGKPGQDRAPKADPPAHAGQHGSALPQTPAERERMLADLYALLATADDEETAKAVAEAIERIWVHSGSPTVDLLMERAMKAVTDKKLDFAMQLLDHVVVLAPDFTEAWNRRAYVSFVRNDVEHALGDLRRVLALDPNHFKALEGLAQILREIGQKKPALQVYRQLLSVHPYWPGAPQAIEELEREVDGQGI